MTTATVPPPKAPPRPSSGRRPAPNRPVPRAAVAFGDVRAGNGHRIVLFGPGGVGKTTLATLAPGPVAFFDLDDSLGVLAGQLPDGLDIRPVSDVGDWQGVRDALHAGGWDGIRTVVVDSVTKAEEMAAAWVLAHVPLDNGRKAERLEDYGWGKQFGHIYDTFLTLLGDLDQHVRAGRHVVLIAHDCTTEVPNPAGPNWLRWEPRLQSPSSGKNSIRLRVREWADHVLFLGYDVEVEEGKGKGTGTRTLYPVELPHCMAKSRTCDTAMPVARHDPSVWTPIIGPQGD